jgi:hypothetical protein
VIELRKRRLRQARLHQPGLLQRHCRRPRRGWRRRHGLARALFTAAELDVLDRRRAQQHEAPALHAREERRRADAQLAHQPAGLVEIEARHELRADAAIGPRRDGTRGRERPATDPVFVEQVGARPGVDGVGHVGHREFRGSLSPRIIGITPRRREASEPFQRRRASYSRMICGRARRALNPAAKRC